VLPLYRADLSQQEKWRVASALKNQAAEPHPSANTLRQRVPPWWIGFSEDDAKAIAEGAR
jgi:hypothetical protein